MKKSKQICLTLSDSDLELFNKCNQEYFRGSVSPAKLVKKFVTYCLSLKPPELEKII